MNVTRASESRTLRQQVAQLMRRLRAIRRDSTPNDEQVARIERELQEAGGVSACIYFRRCGTDVVPAVDHQKLRAASEWRDAPAAVGASADRRA